MLAVGWRLRGWVLLGTVGSVVLALVGNGGRSHALPFLWLWVPPLSGARIDAHLSQAITRMALLVLAAAWLGVGAQLRQASVPTRTLLLVAGLWSLPLLVSAPMFSSDVYDYVANGYMQVHGFNPYDVGPRVLGRASPIVQTVAPTWRGTPTPYGPGFLLMTRGAVMIAGAHAIVALVLLRASAVAGLAGVAGATTRLARRFGREPGPVLWLVVLNPLVLTSTVSAAHNDVLVVALVLGAFLLNAARRTTAALLLTVGAVEIKAFAVLATVAIVVDHLRRSEGSDCRRLALRDGAVVAGTLVVATALIGLPLGDGIFGGWGWLSSLGVPGQAVTSLTPVDALWELLRSQGPGRAHPAVWRQPLMVDLRLAALLAGVLLIGLVVRHRRWASPEQGAARILVVVLICGSAFWPWYVLWLLPLIAVTGARRARAAFVGASVLLPLTLAPGGSALWGAVHRWPGRTVSDLITLVVAAGLVAVVLTDRTATAGA